MTTAARSLVTLSIACTLAGCATTDPYGSSNATAALFAFCEPSGWAIDWPTPDVPQLSVPERRTLETSVVSVPDLPSHIAYLPDRLPPDVPDIGAPRPAMLPDRPGLSVDELPPSRGAPSLPATSYDVPQLAAPQRTQIATAAPLVIELGAPTRALELGVRQGPFIEDSRACPPALALLTLPCLSHRADWREPARRNP